MLIFGRYVHIVLCFFVHIWCLQFDAAGLAASWSLRRKGLEVNELWLRALVSNEGWQWRLNGVTHTTQLNSLGCEWREGKPQWGGEEPLDQSPPCAKHNVTVVRVSQTTQEQVRLSYESVWAPFRCPRGWDSRTELQWWRPASWYCSCAQPVSHKWEWPRTEPKWCGDNIS